MTTELSACCRTDCKRYGECERGKLDKQYALAAKQGEVPHKWHTYVFVPDTDNCAHYKAAEQ